MPGVFLLTLKGFNLQAPTTTAHHLDPSGRDSHSCTKSQPLGGEGAVTVLTEHAPREADLGARDVVVKERYKGARPKSEGAMANLKRSLSPKGRVSAKKRAKSDSSESLSSSSDSKRRDTSSSRGSHSSARPSKAPLPYKDVYDNLLSVAKASNYGSGSKTTTQALLPLGRALRMTQKESWAWKDSQLRFLFKL